MMETINRTLSAPSIPSGTLKASKAYLFLMPNPNNSRERLVGCVIATRIQNAMKVAVQEALSDESNMVHVDNGLYCYPEPLPCIMGIPRLFVSSSHRRKGIATRLLNSAARTFVHGYELNAKAGDIAFSQPTTMGRLVMESWGKGAIRIYEE